MKKRTNKNITTFEEHLEKRYGKIGTPERDEFERNSKSFIIDTVLREKLTRRAIQSEEDIKLGRVLSSADVIQKTDKLIRK